MSNLFSLKSLRNKPHRDGFDLSFNNTMTAPLGALLPCMFKDCMPGDKFKINTSWFTRSQPCTAPAYSKFTEYVDFFFVPYHFLWRFFPDFISQTNNNNFADSVNTYQAPSFTQHPYFTIIGFNQFLTQLLDEYKVVENTDVFSKSAYNLFGMYANLPRIYDVKRLYEYLGYGNITITKNPSTTRRYSAVPSYHSPVMNIFPLLAYNKIYNDFYRNSQWEKSIPRNFNVDYQSPYSSSMEIPVSGMRYKDTDGNYLDTLFDLKYCNYNKDMFTGVLPNKQFGATALASPLISTEYGNLKGLYVMGNSNSQALIFGVRSNEGESTITSIKKASESNNVGISALAIRQAEFLQKWKEITQSGGTDYVSQMEKHFGVKPNSDIAHRCIYLGGITKNFGADEVVNTNLIGNNEPNIMGKCVNVGNGNLEFSCNEHGILMGIYHISLLPSYSDFGDELLRKTMPTDYVIPELDNIGMQPIYKRQLYSTSSTSNPPTDKIVGYVPRYTEYKSSVDVIHGAFTDVYKNWVTPIQHSFSLVSPSDTSYASLKVNPLTLNNLFNVRYDGSYATDPFFVNLSFDIKAVRNISRDGLPW